MGTLLVHGAGWLAVPLIGLVGLGYVLIVGRRLGASPGHQPRASVVREAFRFAEIYAMFRIGPLTRDQWPVLQSEANRSEDANLARLLNRPVPGKREPR